ncbi:hypothetical protein PR202_ga12169 [Eleusine coracana subsp. coracana]|uniref:Uncharacterized protein n=1 Tax=Eleusine coracana subsp. coracana TaxID=191504 RepID=A0AAV5CAZ0_ELECO|nr:hypothetical protein PR202_ga12169 [Eleusine coracana subsp. coracana]
MAPTVTAPRPHAVIVPYPCSGNINPALQLAKLLHGEGVHVTFVNTEHNQRRMEEAASVGGAANGAGGSSSFRFETIPDGLSDAERAVQDYGLGLSVATSTLRRPAAGPRRPAQRHPRRPAGYLRRPHLLDELRA